MTLGLRRGTVRLEPYTTEWDRLFREEAARLRVALSRWSCQIEHVGSTAIPGLVAKPILDIAVGVPRGVAVEAILGALRELGYAYRGDDGAAGGHVLVREASPLVRTHHLHVVGLGGEQWTAYLMFRDHLRASPEAREAYRAAKTALAAEHPSDRVTYTEEKARVILRLLERAQGR